MPAFLVLEGSPNLSNLMQRALLVHSEFHEQALAQGCKSMRLEALKQLCADENSWSSLFAVMIPRRLLLTCANMTVTDMARQGTCTG